MAITITRLWREDDVGAEGWIGAELVDGTLVALCSVEKWNLGNPNDSLRRGWSGNERHFKRPKRLNFHLTEAELRRDGLGSGALRMRGMPTNLRGETKPTPTVRERDEAERAAIAEELLQHCTIPDAAAAGMINDALFIAYRSRTFRDRIKRAFPSEQAGAA
jgi:hypothetical protein